MATSSSWNYALTSADIIRAAYEDLGEVEPGGTISSALSTLALTRFNMMVKQLQGNPALMPGLKLWTRQRLTLFLSKGQQQYLVGPASTDARATTQYGRTTIDAAEAIGQTEISVTATTDTTTYPGTTVTMTAADIIGIEQDDGTIFWSTISSVAAGDTVTIGTGIDVAAAVGNYVWWFTSRAQRFVEIEAANLIDGNRNETPLEVYRTVQSYDSGVPDKYADGDPLSILVEPLRITTRVTLNSQPTDVTKQLQLTVLYPSEDYDATTDDIAFPQEWFAALSWELAYRLSPSRQWTPEMDMNHKRALSFVMNLNPEVSDEYFRVGGL